MAYTRLANYPRGLRYHKVTDNKVPLSDKHPYHPDDTFARIYEHGQHFCNVVRDVLLSAGWAPEPPATIEDLVAAGKALQSSGQVEEVVAWPVGQTGNPYFIQPLYTNLVKAGETLASLAPEAFAVLGTKVSASSWAVE